MSHSSTPGPIRRTPQVSRPPGGDALLRLAAALSRSRTADDVADAVAYEAVEALGAVFGIILMVEGDAALRTVRVVGADAVVAAQQPQMLLLTDNCASADAARTGRVVLIASGADYDAAYPDMAALRHGLRCGPFAAIPLLVEGKAIGVLAMGFPQAHRFTHSPVAYMTLLGSLCAQALDRARLTDAQKAARLEAESELASRLQAQSSLVDSELRYRTLFESTREAIAVARRGRIAYANPAFVHTFRYPSEDALLGTAPLDLVAPPDRARVRRRLHRKQPGYLLPRFYHATGTRMDGSLFEMEGRVSEFEESGDVYEFVVVRDVTEEQATRRALAASERSYRNLFQQTAIGIAHTSADGHWLTVNDRLCDMLGYSRDELLAKTTPRQVIHPADLDTFASSVAEQLGGRDIAAVATLRLVRRDGAVLWAQASLSAVRSETGALEGILSCVEDITDRKRAEAERDRLNGELAAAYQRERRIAETLQRSLLITQAELFAPGLDVQPIYLAAWDEAAVGGDFYDVVALDNGRTALVVGDVSGKGLTAAARTAEIKFTLRAYLREDGSPASALARLNAFLVTTRRFSPGVHTGEFFVCVTLALVDPGAQRLTASVAGMEQPIILAPAPGGRCDWRMLGGGGVPLGALQGTEYDETVTSFRRGETLLLTSDGITDAYDADGRSYLGPDGVLAIARRHAALPSLEQFGERLVSAAREHAGGRFRDDLCLMLARHESAG